MTPAERLIVKLLIARWPKCSICGTQRATHYSCMYSHRIACMPCFDRESRKILGNNYGKLNLIEGIEELEQLEALLMTDEG